MVNSTSSCSASARKPTCPRLTPSSGVPLSRVSSAARRIVPSPPNTTAISQPADGLGLRLDDLQTRQVRGRGRPPRPRAAGRASPCAASARQNWPRDVARVLAGRCGRSTKTAASAVVGAWSRVHLLTRHPQGRGTAYLRGDLVGVRRAPAPRRSQRKYSTLPDGPGSGLVVTARAPQPAPRRPPRPPVTAAARRSRSRTTPPLPTLSLPTSNCGLTISARSPSARVTPSSASSTSPREMNDRSPTTRSTGPPTSSGVSSRMLVRSCTTTRSSLLQRPGQLAVADVDRDHLGRTVAQQHVGEPAGRGAGVEAAAPGDLEPERAERRQRAGQLVPAAGDVVGPVRVLEHHERDVRGHPGGRLGGDRTGHLHPPGGDQLAGVLTRAGQPAADQLGVEAQASRRHVGSGSVGAAQESAGGSPASARAPRSRSWAASKTATCSATGTSSSPRRESSTLSTTGWPVRSIARRCRGAQVGRPGVVGVGSRCRVVRRAGGRLVDVVARGTRRHVVAHWAAPCCPGARPAPLRGHATRRPQPVDGSDGRPSCRGVARRRRPPPATSRPRRRRPSTVEPRRPRPRPVQPPSASARPAARGRRVRRAEPGEVGRDVRRTQPRPAPTTSSSRPVTPVITSRLS